MKAYHIYLLRHGMTQDNREGRYIGRIDSPLSSEGEEQLRGMRERFDYPYAELFFSSPKLRCLQTLGILYPDAEPLLVEDFRECDFGDYEGRTVEELKNDPSYQLWATGGGVGTPPNGENSRDFQQRCCAAFEGIVGRLMRSGGTTAVMMAHGGTIMSILGRYAFPRRLMFEWMTGNGTGYEVVLTPQLWMNAQALEVAGVIPEGAQEKNLGGDTALIDELRRLAEKDRKD